jgi:hypothetical protein
MRTCLECCDRRRVKARDAADREAILAGLKRCRPCALGTRRRDDDLDEIAVERLVAGRPVRSTVAERLEAMRRLPTGLSARQTAERFGVASRTIVRYRSELKRMAA